MADPRKKCAEDCPRRDLLIDSPRLSGIGPRNAKILLVGEAPGQDEDAKGIPFIGASGQLLNELLEDVGLSRERIYITNAVKCATPDENIKPKKKEIKCCAKYLQMEINGIKPNVIAAAGAIALDAVLKRTGITKLQNNVFFDKELGVKAVPILHPAHVLRNPSMYDSLKRGLEIVKQEAAAREKVYVSKIKTRHLDVRSPKKIDALLDKLESVKAFVFDLETTSLNPLEAKILLIAFSWAEGLGVTVQWDRFSKEQLNRLQKIFLSKKTKVGHNLKYDVRVLFSNGFRVRGPYMDTLPAIALIDENLKDKSLDSLTLRYLDLGEYWAPLDIYKKEYCKKHKILAKDFTYDKLPYKMLASYAQCDADATYRLFRMCKTKLKKYKLSKFYKKYTIPTFKVLLEMEHRGIRVNRKKLKKIIAKYDTLIEDAHKEIMTNSTVKKYIKIRSAAAAEVLVDKWTGSKILRGRYPNSEDYVTARIKEKDCQFNPKSVLQLREILYKMLKLKVLKKSDKGAPSTDADTLKLLDEKYEVELVQAILKHRQLTKFMTTYLVSTYEKSAIDGRVHPSYMQHRAVTGRLACENPNFQNVPRDAYEFKKCFKADPGMIIVKADLAQAEFRCWAHYANDEDMIHDIEAGLDIHKQIASEIFGIDPDDVTKDQRTAAKNCVSGATWIPTAHGFRKISELKEGDVVLDHFNREQTILETISKEDDLYFVETECGSLQCTKDHPIYTINDNAEIAHKPLSEFNPGDYILACTPENRSRDYVSWKYTGDRNTSFKPIKKQWRLDPDMGYLLGFIVAEGSISEKPSRINTSWSQKGKFVNTINTLSTKLFGDRVKQYKDKRTGVIDWRVSSLEFVEFLKHVGMCTDNKKGFKSFPHKIMESPVDVQKAFLQGYFLGDGTFKNHIACVGTVSKELCNGICLLLRNFGIYPKIHTEHPKGGEDFYNIHITTNEELDILTKKIEVKVPENWTPPKQNNGRKFLHNVNAFYQANHPDCNVRYHTKLRNHITHLFLKKNCLGVNPAIDKLIEHGIYSVRINSITKLGTDKVYDFVTTGDKVMVANGFYTHDCVFGLMYGRGTKAISEQYGISEEDAEKVRTLFFERYPAASLWLAKQVQFVKEYGYVRTWMGRIRRLPDVNSDDHMVQAEAERQAKNSPIQALASDMNNHFMVMNLKLAKKRGVECTPWATIHDANLLQVPKKDVGKLVKIMKTVVAKAFPDFRCRMDLDFEIGKTLGTLKEVNV